MSRSRRSRFSSDARSEFMKVAGIRRRRRPETWSDISALSGETTRQRPGVRTAGIWKARLLPDPVGLTSSRERPRSAASTTSICAGRKASNPNSLKAGPRCPVSRASLPSMSSQCAKRTAAFWSRRRASPAPRCGCSAAWHIGHRLIRFAGSSVPPDARGKRWCTCAPSALRSPPH